MKKGQFALDPFGDLGATYVLILGSLKSPDCLFVLIEFFH